MRQCKERQGQWGREWQLMAEAGLHSLGNTEEPSAARAEGIGEGKGTVMLLTMEILEIIF